MSAESGTDKAVRREKIVMALGIVAIILFSANLFTMIARHVWPDFRFESLYASLYAGDCQLAMTEVERVEATTDNHTVHVLVNRWKHHDGEHSLVVPFDARTSYRENADNVEADLRAEMDRLSRDIARQHRRLDVDMATRQDARLKTLHMNRIRMQNRARKHAEEATTATPTVSEGSGN